MNKNNIILICNNQYCVFNKNKKCVREEVSLNKIGVCEDMFLLSANNIENLQKLKSDYLKNMINPTNQFMKDDVNWFFKQQNAKEIHPLDSIFEGKRTKLS